MDFRLFTVYLTVTILLAACARRSQPQPPTWIESSNKIAAEFTHAWAERYPEGGSRFGFRQYDDKAMQLDNEVDELDLKFYIEWQARLKKMVASEENPELLTDLKVLLQKVENRLENIRLQKRFGVIPFYRGTKFVFESLKDLVNPQSGQERRHAAVTRFKAYVNGHGQYKPILKAFRELILHTQKKSGGRPQLWALKEEMESYLGSSPDYIKGIERLLRDSGRDDWRSDYQNFVEQAKSYDQFVKERLLKSARTSYRLPQAIYQHILRSRGIPVSPEELIHIALADYKTVYAHFEELALQIAIKHSLNRSDPVSVIRHLKSKQVMGTLEARKLYVAADKALAEIIKKHDIVSLPSVPLRIRIADEAESKAEPVPHLTVPGIVNNRGERPEFVVPSSASGRLPYDDFSYEAAAIVLTAHEGRPGHDLQYSAMLDRRVSIIRAFYAYNNVNVEGWGLYAEDLVFPYLSQESQLIALQMRLWRISRMFLDPQIHLGQIGPHGVVEHFTKQLGFSQRMAELEVKRYIFANPGQAPSYYYGLKRFLAAKERLRRKLGLGFTNRCFHDAVLDLGLLPIDWIAERLESGLRCAPSKSF